MKTLYSCQVALQLKD